MSSQSDKLPEYDACLSPYISASEEDPELKSFCSSLQQRTIKLIKSVGSVYGRGGKNGNLPLDSLMEICGFLVEGSQGAVKTIMDNKYDISKNKELKSLVDLYFESTTKTLDLFNTVEKCVEKAQSIQFLIRVAIKLFETESLDTDFGGKKKKKYAETLERLNEVKAMEDPFGDEFATQYKSVYDEQVMLLNKIREMQVMLEKKHKNVKKWRRLGIILYLTTLFSVIALSAYISVALPPAAPVVAKVAIGLTAIIAAADRWLNKMLTDKEEAIKTQYDLLLSTKNSTQVNIRSMETIKSLVYSLKTMISSILKTAEVAVEMREDVVVKLAMQEIIKKVEGFGEKIEQIGALVAKCTKVVTSERVHVLEHLANPASLNGK